MADHCFAESSRINSTWGGNLVDMVRCTRFIEIIHEDNLVTNAAERGAQAVQRLQEVQAGLPEALTNVRGQGLFVAFDLVDTAQRPHLLRRALEHGLIILPAGTRSIRMRPSLNVTAAEIDEAVAIIQTSMREVLDGKAAGVGA